MNSFIENVNYLANLDNKYGSRVEIYKNNLSLRTELHDIVFTLEYYNFSDKKLHTLEYSYSDISIDNFNSTLLNLKSQVELNGLFDCVVSFSYTNFIINNVANIDIKIISNSDNIKTYGFNLNITKDLTEIYNINGIVSDTLKILPVVASFDSSFIDGVATIQENIYVIQNAEANAIIASEKAVEALSSSNIAIENATISINNASIAILSANNSEISAELALTSATTATQQADIATVKSTEASASASSALISKNESATNSSNSLVNANNASISEANAIAYKNSALSSKNSSAVSETNALSYSNLAHASELSSQSSATSAASSAINASNSEVASASSATLSSAKATESFNSANDALTGKNKAEKWAIELEDVPVEPGKYSAMHWALKAEELVSGSASSVSYDNSTSVLVANDVQSAIDEIDTNIETLSSNVYTKTDINNSLALKVDKIAGKGLSTEDYTTIEKTKLSGIASGAQVNVPTDLSLGTVTATVISINSSTGTDVNLPSATTSTAGLLSATDKTKLDGIADNANNYTLPVATSTVKGVVELYSDTVQTVASNAVSTAASRTYGIQLNSAGQVVVNVPWADTDTVYTHPTADGYLHVPATSTTNNGKVLMAGATAGSVSWQTIPSGVTDHTLLTNIGTNTHAQIDTAMTRLANTSGTNTGDETLASIKSKLGISTLSGSNTGDQTITLTGDITGSGTGSFATALSNTGVTAGTYKSVTVDLKGRITSGTNPTTISGFCISDAYTKTEIDLVVGDINSVLDTINGQVI